jgi:hypothetical protein
MGGNVKREVHQGIEELRLALSKKDFRGFASKDNLAVVGL